MRTEKNKLNQRDKTQQQQQKQPHIQPKMVLNVWNQIFGSSRHTKNAETIRTAVMSESIEATAVPHATIPPLMAAHRGHRCNGGQAATTTTSRLSIFILFGSLSVCIFTIGILLLSHVNRVSDINHLRAAIRRDFIAKSDVELAVWQALQDLRDNGVYVATTRATTIYSR